jgi:YidC/Oxa1 family membrane protein insertase
MLPMLRYFADMTHSWGWSIICLTLLVRVVVAPLVQSSTLSMRKMSQLQPQMKAIQDRYKDDPEKLQAKLMEFYKKNKMNPMGGCLPMLVQLPILFALYGAFAGPPFMDKPIDVPVKVVAQADAAQAHRDETSKNTLPYVSKDGVMAKLAVFPGEATVVAGTQMDFGVRPVAGQLPNMPEFGWKVIPKGTKDANVIPVQPGTTLQTTFNSTGEYVVEAKVPGIAANEPFGPITSLGKVAKGLELLNPHNWDILVLILLFGGTTYLSSLFSTGTSQNTPESEMTEQQLIQKQTMKMMPITMTVMFCFIPLPAGVFLYFVVSNLFQVLQTWWLMKQPTPEIITVVDDDDKGSGGGSGGSGVPRGSQPKGSGGGAKPKGSSGGSGKSSGSSGDSPSTMSGGPEQALGIAASGGSGSTLKVDDASQKRKAKKKKK